jgi:hypothetical protein
MKGFLKTSASLATGVILFCGSPAIGSAQSTVIPARTSGPVASGKDNYAFLSANRVQFVVDLQKAGYVEEEFLVSGTANVYDWLADGSVKVKTANAPYTTRILIRRPATSSKFSGNVILEPFENNRSFDWAFLWPASYEYFLDHGDAWVGVTHNPEAIAALKKFNPARYASLSMANPAPDVSCGPANSKSDVEAGLKFDIFSQVAAALKSPTGPMPGFKVERVYATSHTGEVVTYAHAIQPAARVFDGFVMESNAGVSTISRCSANPAADDPRRITKNVGVPVIRMVPEGDVLAAYALRRADSDETNDRFRWYEVAAAPRMDNRYYQHMPVTEDQTKAGQTPVHGNWPFAFGCESPVTAITEVPVFQVALNAAFYNLDQWSRKGIAPPRAERMTVKGADTPQASVAVDQYGNGLGGIRSPHVDVPAATYYTHAPGQATCRNIGYKVSFGWNRLETLYGSSKNYAAQVNQKIDQLVKDKWLLQSDATRLRNELIPPANVGRQ